MNKITFESLRIVIYDCFGYMKELAFLSEPNFFNFLKVNAFVVYLKLF